jgi:hypothetical protein
LPDFIFATSCDSVTCFGNSKCVVLESGSAVCQPIEGRIRLNIFHSYLLIFIESHASDICSTIRCGEGRTCVFRLGIAECLAQEEINAQTESGTSPVSI